jgi:hypothetical protein
VSDLVSLLLLSGADVQRGQCHPYFHADGLYNTAGQVPSADLLELTDRLAGREARSPFGYDSTARWEALKKIVAAVGLPDTWGECPACAGTGQDPASKEAHDAWEETPPPVGEGYQVWETVSEGSPISPVFATPPELAAWMAIHWKQDGTYDQWLAFIVGPGWAPSLVTSVGADGRFVVQTGVQAGPGWALGE